MARILVVDDERQVQSTLRSFFEMEGNTVDLADSYDAALSLVLKNRVDLVVTDIMLGKQTGLDLLSAVKKYSPNCPVIVFTGQPDLSTAIECVREGAFDYLQKPFKRVELLETAKKALESARRQKELEKSIIEKMRYQKVLEDRVNRQKLEIERTTRALIKSEERYRSLVSAIPEVILEFDVAYKCVWFNGVAAALFGDDIYNKGILEFFQGEDERYAVSNAVQELRERTKEIAQIKAIYLAKDGEEKTLSWTLKLYCKSFSSECGVIATAIDVTDMTELEQQLERKARLETIGEITGGIAHDFNNLLTAIMAQAELIRIKGKENPEIYRAAQIINNGAVRAKELTGKLLGFAKGGKSVHASLDLHSVIGEVIKLAGASFDQKIVLESECNATKSVIEGDSSQVYQVVLNLVLNAKDAILEKCTQSSDDEYAGKILIRTNIISGGEMPEVEERADNYIKVSVVDNGCGIAKKDLNRIFEPFYTTKHEKGGTGMGLAMVYGIVQNHGGFLEVRSEPGQGTQFDIFFPLSLDQKAVCDEQERSVAVEKGEGTVLVVDDEEIVRTSMESILASLGYKVLCAAGKDDAYSVFKKHLELVDLVLLDLTITGFDISRYALEIKELKPSVKILLTSGFGINREAKNLLKQGADGFINKPCSLAELAKALSDALKKE